MKKRLKKTTRRSLTALKKGVVRVPVLHKIAKKTRSRLFKEFYGGPREIYEYRNFYPTIKEYTTQLEESTKLIRQPLMSLLLPTYNTPEEYLRECIDSVLIQSYPRWELCIADDASSDQKVRDIIKEYAAKDKRIKYLFRSKNGHISEASNSAATIATGEYICLLDHDDVLWPNALFEMVSIINDDTDVDFIYSDEDKIDGSGSIHSFPFLKPGLSPEFLESCNYITHFSCIRRTIMKEIGGFRKGCEGAQDWDLFVRIIEKTNKVHHIPKLLYSWRIHEASTASNTDAKPYVYEAQKKLLQDHLERTGRNGEIETGIISQHRTIKYQVKPSKVCVAIFVQSFDDTKQLLQSMERFTAGITISVLFVYDRKLDIKRAQEAKLYTFLPQAEKKQMKTPRNTMPYIEVAHKVDAEHIIFVEDMVEIKSKDWGRILIADNQISGVGMVGPVLLNTTGTQIHSAGIGVGYGPEGVIDMLQNMSFDDPHYSRGLYAKSRRNVSALNPALFSINRKALLDVGSDNIITTAVNLIKKGYRHIYTPYVQAKVCGLPVKLTTTEDIKSFEDPYLNPNFNHSNQRMEIET